MTTVDAETSRRHWDAQAATYDRAKTRNAAYYRSLARLVGEAVPGSHRGRVLEAGCGTGQILASLEPRAGIGIDVSEAMIRRARERHAGRPDLAFRVADAADAATGGPFDAVVCTDVLEHVADWRVVVDTLAAACGEGGILVLTTPSPLWAAPLWVLEKLHLKMPEGPHRYVARRAVAARLRQRGMQVLRVETHGVIPAGLMGLGPLVSRVAARLPGLSRCGVIQLVVATRSPGRSS